MQLEKRIQITREAQKNVPRQLKSKPCRLIVFECTDIRLFSLDNERSIFIPGWCKKVLVILWYNVSESKLPKIQQISPNFTVFTFDKRSQTVISRENLFFRSFLEVSSGICAQILRFRNKFLPFAL